MIIEQNIRDFAREMAKKYSPEKIILFGSHVSGNQNYDSDVDLLVVMNFEGRRAGKAAEVICSINPDFPIDLILRRPAEIRKRLEMGDYFIEDIIREGKTLYDRSSPGMA